MLSRVADSLYWMSRYLERAEHISRMLLVHLNISLDQSPSMADVRGQRLLDSMHITPPEGETNLSEYRLTELIALDPDNDNSIANCIAAARENSRHVREQISSEMWEQLNSLYLQVKGAKIETMWEEEPYVFLRNVRDGIHLFDGITDSTMNHSEGWYFIQAGRYIERASAIARLLDVNTSLIKPGQSNGSTQRDNYLEWVGLLKSCTAFEAYCKIYTADIHPNTIVEFLLLNAEFPHSIGFAIDRLQVSVDAIAELTEKRKAIRTNRLVGRMRAALNFDQIDEIMAGDLHRYLMDIQSQCGQIHTAIQQTYITYPIDYAISS